jgi:hypothetical protein
MMKKVKSKFLLASMKSLTNSANQYRNALQRSFGGDFGLENAYRKRPVILKVAPLADYITV